jgi:hypothetical protein
MRIGLAAGGLAVAGLVGWLVVATRAGPVGPIREERIAPDRVAAPRPAPVPPGDGASRGASRADESGDASLPGAAEVAAARARVAAERPRPSFLSPDLDMDHKLKARPLRDARKAYQRGEFERALARAQDALAVAPDSSAARVLAVLAACSLGQAAAARGHAARLDDMRRARVAARCQELGVDLAGARESAEHAEAPPPTSTM